MSPSACNSNYLGDCHKKRVTKRRKTNNRNLLKWLAFILVTVDDGNHLGLIAGLRPIYRCLIR
ncbi:hypothetical protein EG330_01100 [Pectobacterium versatile]|nr:hypothetical protein EG330_01100 [Pectobacterium versatile]